MGGRLFDRGDTRALGGTRALSKRVDTDGSASQNLEVITRWSSGRASTPRAPTLGTTDSASECVGTRAFDASQATGRAA